MGGLGWQVSRVAVGSVGSSRQPGAGRVRRGATELSGRRRETLRTQPAGGTTEERGPAPEDASGALMRPRCRRARHVGRGGELSGEVVGGALALGALQEAGDGLQRLDVLRRLRCKVQALCSATRSSRRSLRCSSLRWNGSERRRHRPACRRQRVGDRWHGRTGGGGSSSNRPPGRLWRGDECATRDVEDGDVVEDASGQAGG